MCFRNAGIQNGGTERAASERPVRRIPCFFFRSWRLRWHPHRPHLPLSRMRQVVMILVFDLGGPLLAFALLRSAGTGAVASLVISGVLPALGIAIGVLVDRRLDVIGPDLLQGGALRLRGVPVHLDAGLRRAREEEGRTPGRCHRGHEHRSTARPAG